MLTSRPLPIPHVGPLQSDGSAASGQIMDVGEQSLRTLDFVALAQLVRNQAIYLPRLFPRARYLRNADPAKKNADIGHNGLSPVFLRHRSTPPRHHVASRQLDREVSIHYHPHSQLIGDSIVPRKAKEEGKDDTWNRLNGLTTFAFRGFGFFRTLVGACTYKRGRKTNTMRKADAEEGDTGSLSLRYPSGVE